jgi:hypothetical protein
VKPYQPDMSMEQEEEIGRYESPDHRQDHRLESRDEQPRGWEFKILRTNGNGFRRPLALQKACREEAQSGWILLEKLDDRRLRFRRPLLARQGDREAKIDPYRSHYGISSELAAVVTVTTLLVVLAIPTYLGFTLMQSIFKSLSTQKIPAAPKLTSPSPVAPSPKPRVPNPQ